MRNEQKKNIHPLKKIILSYLEKISCFEKGMKLKDNAESLHQLRVYCRRLLLALWIVRDFLPTKKMQKWEKKISEFAEVLGKARDLDVQLDLLRNSNGEKGANKAGKSGFKKIIVYLKKRRIRLNAAIYDSMQKIKEKKIFDKIKKALEDAIICEDRKISALAGRKITKKLNALLKMERWVCKPQRLDKLHKMRLSAKHLRYALESLEFLYGKEMNEFTEAAHAVQNALGKMHDLDVCLEKLKERQKSNDFQVRRAAQVLAGRCRRLRAEYYEDFVRLWETLKKQKLWRRLREKVEKFC